MISVNSLPKEKILEWCELQDFSDNKINVKEKFKFSLGREENMVEKGENAGYQHFLLFPQCFLTLYHTIPTFNDPKVEGFGKLKCW